MAKTTTTKRTASRAAAQAKTAKLPDDSLRARLDDLRKLTESDAYVHRIMLLIDGAILRGIPPEKASYLAAMAFQGALAAEHQTTAA
ncbi:MAG: hypothetical protein Q7P63_01315 [Verrucomicrobiota bacterium JB022]|nr:hypothetical protein [Verrucomicrobiota bacterium JB022]